MANNEKSPLVVTVPEAITKDGITHYVINVQVGKVSWSVKHRYSQFQQMHDQLVEEGLAGRDLLPPKKLLGSKEPSFIMKRRRELETYLQSICHFLEKSLPPALSSFLCLELYSLHHVIQQLAELTHQEEEQGGIHQVTWTPLEMFAITERLQTPCPPQDTDDKKSDFTNVVETCCRLQKLSLSGSKEQLGSSNIIPNDLNFDFLAFKTLSSLQFDSLDISPLKITSLGILRATLQTLVCTNCSLNSVSQLLLCDKIHKNEDLPSLITESSLTWPVLRSLDVSKNNISETDCSLRLAAKSLSTVNLSNNSITDLNHFTGLPNLTSINLSGNKLKDISALHTKLGQVSKLDLSHNSIRQLEGLSRVYSLSWLDASNNKLRTLTDVTSICSLPCLEHVVITPNKVNNEVDYRLKVLEAFGSRSGEIVLDNQPTTQPELDKVSVLMALSVSREGKSPTYLFGNLPQNYNL